MPAVMEKIEAVEARRAELSVELDGARQLLEKAKAALIAGEGGATKRPRTRLPAGESEAPQACPGRRWR